MVENLSPNRPDTKKEDVSFKHSSTNYSNFGEIPSSFELWQPSKADTITDIDCIVGQSTPSFLVAFEAVCGTYQVCMASC